MANNSDTNGGPSPGFGSFAAKKMLPVVAAVAAVMAALWVGIQYFETADMDQQALKRTVSAQKAESPAGVRADAAHAPMGAHVDKDDHAAATAPAAQAMGAEDDHAAATTPAAQVMGAEGDHAAATAPAAQAMGAEGDHAAAAAPAVQDTEAEDGHHETVESGDADHAADKTIAAEKTHMALSGSVGEKAHAPADSDDTGHGQAHEEKEGGHGGEHQAKTYPAFGMALVDALIEPMDYELNHRFYGWRPNDIIEHTDNINNYQLGVLEVTRRTTRILAERIARTGSTARFDPNLENAMNWFMIKADRYWFPSAESKYQDGLKELRAYYHKLEQGEAEFYTRTDNLIPLLAAYQDLLGSCDENLVKTHEVDGREVSFFKSDDYFFYAKGVVSAMHTILIAVEHDFHNAMETREGSLEVLHHAIESCHHAMEVDPWFILDSSYGSIWANHRANMAAPISHARFYLGVLIKTLST